MASATASNVIQGQCLKSHFVPIWVLALWTSSFNFFKELHLKIIWQIHPTDLIQAKVLLIWLSNNIFIEKISKLCINWHKMWFQRLTMDHVLGCSWGHVCLIWLQFSDNVGMILLSIWYSHKKKVEVNQLTKNSSFQVYENLWITL